MNLLQKALGYFYITSFW